MNFLGSALTTIKPRKDDTLIDRLNYYYTSMIIIGLSVTLTAKQYVGQPIQCWVPPEFSHAWEQYAENYCFVYNTYWVKPDEQIPRPIDERVNRQLFYYQWVPFLMALEAGFFYFPVFFWSKTNRKSGINIKLMIEQKESVQECGSESSERLKAVHKVSQHIEDAFKLLQLRKRKNNRKIIGNNIFKMGIYDGTYLTNMYFITRILYILNIIGQIRIMNHFLGQNDLFWGAHILSDVIRGRNWELSGIFPRVALCDFTIRTLSNIQRYSIQCVLMLNMFNEKIFLFLYWWLIFVGVLTTIDTFKWILNTRISNRRIIYFRKFISSVTKEEEHLFNEFSNKMIGADGTMLLIMLSTNGGELFIQQILNILWLNYLKYSQLRQVMFSSQKENASINNSFESIEQLSHKN